MMRESLNHGAVVVYIECRISHSEMQQCTTVCVCLSLSSVSASQAKNSASVTHSVKLPRARHGEVDAAAGGLFRVLLYNREVPGSNHTNSIFFIHSTKNEGFCRKLGT